MSLDPVVTDPDNYKVVSENDYVRVLEYNDRFIQASGDL